MRERRKAPRYPLGIAGKFHVARGSVAREVVVDVISTLGCALVNAEGASAGKRCELYFDWQDALIGVEAQIVEKDAKGRIGLKFLDVDHDTQARLTTLCAALRAQPLAKLRREESERAQPLAESLSPREGARSAWPTAARPSAPSHSGKPPGEPRTAPQVGAARPPSVAGPARGQRERRRVPRYISDLPTRLSNLASGMNWSLTLVTLSVLGGCAEGSGLPQPGQPYELITEWEGKPLRIEAEVVWKGKDQIGFKFTSPSAEAVQLLREICSNLRLQPLAPLPPEPS